MGKNFLKFVKREVEWKTLEEVVSIKRGVRLIKSQLSNKGKYPVYQNSLTPLGYYDESNQPMNTTFLISAGAAGEIGYSTTNFWAADDCFCLVCPENILSRYLYHALLLQQNLIFSSVRRSSVPRLARRAIENIKIPIPPLKVQDEIVKVLDKMTKYVTELTTELTNRNKQYAYYRDLLLSEESLAKVGFEWKKLEEVVTEVDKVNWKSLLDEEVFQYIDLSSVDRNLNSISETTEITKEKHPSRAQQIVKEKDIIFGTTRPTLKRYAIINSNLDSQIASTGFTILRPDENKILSKFVYFSISTDRFLKYVEQHQKGASYPAISDSEVKNYKLAIPPFSEQVRIVAILDRFDELTKSLTEGLPKEIELRQKQYEYYRDKLLTFKGAE